MDSKAALLGANRVMGVAKGSVALTAASTAAAPDSSCTHPRCRRGDDAASVMKQAQATVLVMCIVRTHLCTSYVTIHICSKAVHWKAFRGTLHMLTGVWCRCRCSDVGMGGSTLTTSTASTSDVRPACAAASPRGVHCKHEKRR